MPAISETEMFSKAIGVIDIIWIDEENNVISNPISPKDSLGGLTAVKYNGTNWVQADTNNTNNDWYNYVAQTGTIDGKTSNWANARSSDEKAYFVWIPRYAYKITYFDSETNANIYRNNNSSTIGIVGYSTIDGMIDITSGKRKLVEGTEPINVTGNVKTPEYAEYIPHPAFEFDGAKAGIWVGKFEASGNSEKVTIIADTNALVYEVNRIFTSCQGVKDTYGLTQSIDSHMMKNTEWGAVAYLTESKYGRNGMEIETNGSNRLTGGGDYKANVLQSTTGNIYGIYDMSGTSFEYVAGYIENERIKEYDFNTSLLEAVKKNNKYADIYKVTEDKQEINYRNSKGMKGDGIYEISTRHGGNTSWHEDFSIYPNDTVPVYVRGRRFFSF